MSDEQRIPPEILAEQWYNFIQSTIGKLQSAFRVERKKTGLTQKSIAAKLGRKPSFISRCLSGQRNMRVRTMHDLARAMDCRLEVNFIPLQSLRPANYRPVLEEWDSADGTGSTGEREISDAA